MKLINSLLLIVMALWPFSAATAATTKTQAPGVTQQRVADEVEQFLVERVAGLFDGEPAIFVAEPPTGLQECDQIDVFLPRGRKIASRTTVAVRCLGSEDSPIYVRADVKVHGVHYVPNQTIGANQTISADMLEPKPADLMRLPNGTSTDVSQLVGRIAAQRLSIGRPIKLSATRSGQSILRGQRVRIEVQVPGMSVTNQGEALSTADVGAPIQVKTDQGKILQAIVKQNGVVGIAL